MYSTFTEVKSGAFPHILNLKIAAFTHFSIKLRKSGIYALFYKLRKSGISALFSEEKAAFSALFSKKAAIPHFFSKKASETALFSKIMKNLGRNREHFRTFQ